MASTRCDMCENYYYDEETDSYCCDINLDEDEMMRFISSADYNCPYFRFDDDYRIVKKQN